jgi:hypothetical protein
MTIVGGDKSHQAYCGSKENVCHPLFRLMLMLYGYDSWKWEKRDMVSIVIVATKPQWCLINPQLQHHQSLGTRIPGTQNSSPVLLF